MSEDLVFIQRSRFGRTIFFLRAETLEIKSHLFGKKSSQEVPVRSISPDYTLESRSFGLAVAITGAGAALCFALFFLIIYRWELPALVAQLPVYGGVLCLSIALTLIRRMEYFTFNDQWGRPLFSILREHEQADECDAFVHALLDRIELLENPHDLGDSAARPAGATQRPRSVASAVRLDSDDPTRVVPATPRWKFSLAAGFVSTVYPPIAYTFRDYALEPVIVVVISSTLGIFATFLSFQAKEPRRSWSLLGAALCLCPLLLPLNF